MKQRRTRHKDWYHLSRPCESLDCFVSHSWRQGRWMKTMALAIHLHWKLALLLAALSIVATAASFPFWAPSNLCTAQSDFTMIYVRASAIMIIPGVVFLAMVLWGQRITFARADCFVDKMCICQTDLRLKEHAIKSFDLFLRFSQRMVVLSPTYLQRLWCVDSRRQPDHCDAASRDRVRPGTRAVHLQHDAADCDRRPLSVLAFCTLPFMSQVFDHGGATSSTWASCIQWSSSAPSSSMSIALQMVNQRTFRLADAGASSADDVATVHRLIELTWASEPGATDGRAR